jgi:hypothetical protein
MLLAGGGLGLAQEARQPKINNVTAAVGVEGAPLWLFAVADGSKSTVAVSAERSQEILIGRLPLARPSSRVRWKVVAGRKDTGGVGIADHWHIFAHDSHWISFSTARANQSYLLKLDRSFVRQGLWTVARGERRMPTNDHFLVAEKDGVAVGHFLPGYGTRLFRFDRRGRLRAKIDLGGGRYRHGNGSSAYRSAGGHLLLASEHLNMVAQGSVLWIEADSQWALKSVKTLLEEKRAHIAMPSGVRLNSGYWIIHARVCSGAYPRGVRPPPAPPRSDGRMAPDDGAIVRYLISPKGAVVSRRVLVDKGGNRPHTALVGNRLITTWDGRGGAKIRIDKVVD